MSSFNVLLAVVLVVDVVVFASSSMPHLLPQVRPWRGRGHKPHRGNLWNRELSGELVPCEEGGLKIPLGDPTPEEFTSLFVPVSVSGMRRGRDGIAQCLCQGWQEVGARMRKSERSCDPHPFLSQYLSQG